MKDEVDLANVSVQQELNLRLLDRSRQLVIEINHAIEKVITGDFGYCEGTGEEIPKED